MNASDESLQVNAAAFTVVNKHPMSPCSTDVHDYCSMCVYCWPDPKNASAPWPNVDGLKNPIREKKEYSHDKPLWYGLVQHVQTLSLRYHLLQWTNTTTQEKLSTGKPAEEYAKRALEFIYVWFVNPSTRMNPSAEYAQSRPNAQLGRGAGIIEFSGNLPVLLDSLIYLRTSQYFSQELDRGIIAWISEFLKWNVESKAGQTNAKRENNIITWFTGMKLAMTLYLSSVGPDATDATYGGLSLSQLQDQLVANATQILLSQVDEQGSQPKETQREMPYHYSGFNLKALNRLGMLVDSANVPKQRRAYPTMQYANLGSSLYWRVGAPNFKLAVDYLLPQTLTNVSALQPALDYDRVILETVLRSTHYIYNTDGRYYDAFECIVGLRWDEWPNVAVLKESAWGLNYVGPRDGAYYKSQPKLCSPKMDSYQLYAAYQNGEPEATQWILSKWDAIPDPELDDGSNIVLPTGPAVRPPGNATIVPPTRPVDTQTSIPSNSRRIMVGILILLACM